MGAAAHGQMSPRRTPPRDPNAPVIKDGIEGFVVFGDRQKTVREFFGLPGGEFVLYDHHGRELKQGDRDDAMAWVTGVDY